MIFQRKIIAMKFFRISYKKISKKIKTKYRYLKQNPLVVSLRPMLYVAFLTINRSIT